MYYNTDIEIDIDEIIDEIPTEDMIEELKLRNNDSDERKKILELISELNPQKSMQDKFESSPTAALNVLQDLLGMQHTTTKDQVIEQLNYIL